MYWPQDVKAEAVKCSDQKFCPDRNKKFTWCKSETANSERRSASEAPPGVKKPCRSVRRGRRSVRPWLKRPPRLRGRGEVSRIEARLRYVE